MKKVIKIISIILAIAIVAYFAYALFVSIRVNSIINSAADLDEYNSSVSYYISERDYNMLKPRHTSKVYSYPKENIKTKNSFRFIFPFFTTSIRNVYGYDIKEDNSIYEEIESSIVTFDIDYTHFPFRIKNVQLWNEGM